MLKPINLTLGFNLDVERELSQLAAFPLFPTRCELGQLALHHGTFSVPSFTRFGVVCSFKLGHCLLSLALSSVACSALKAHPHAPRRTTDERGGNPPPERIPSRAGLNRRHRARPDQQIPEWPECHV